MKLFELSFKKQISVLVVMVLFIILNHNAMADSFVQKMKVESVFVQNMVSPILKGNEFNPVLLVKIEVSGKSSPLNLEEVSLNLFGDNIKNNIDKVQVYYAREEINFVKAIKFGDFGKGQKELLIVDEQILTEGINYVWVSIKINETANILNKLGVSCLSLKIGGILIIPENNSKPQLNYLGIALRKHLDDNVDTYRIPGLATTNRGTLVAVYDIRKNNSTDLQEDIDIGLSRSTDGGRTWEPMKIIMDMGMWGGKPQRENGIGDPAVLVDRQTNTIWVAAVWAHGHPGKRNWWASKPGLKPVETSQFILVKSEDDGLTWSDPINITNQIKDSNWNLLLQGPGKGITLKNGTLVFPAQFKDEEGMPFSTIIWSRNNGKTWHIGTGAKSNTTEAQVVELNNGRLMLNMRDNRNRNDSLTSNGRAVYTTGNMGKTWEMHSTSRTNVLQESTCQASIIKGTFIVNGKKSELILFSNPNTKKGRHHMTIKASLDDGLTWPAEQQLLLDEGNGRGYSCMSKIDDYTVGILYEGSQADMTFQAIAVKDILKEAIGLNFLFEGGKEGYGCFRIPAIVSTKSGAILAFAEARKNSCSDTGDIDLVLKRSGDGGRTWSSLQVVWDDGQNVCGNPAPVVDTETGIVYLLSTWNLGEDHESEIINGQSKDTRRVFVLSSSDDGKTWSTPKEITSSTKEPNWTWYATGPCHGIQLKNSKYKGRLVVPCDHIETATKKYYSHIIYSDDHGNSWKLGGTTPSHQVNECTVAEFNNGKLILNMRNYDYIHKNRKISLSSNGGESWGNLFSDSMLVEPICQASLLAINGGKTLYFSNPSSKISRSNMQLKVSFNEGRSWEVETILFAGPAAYSDLAQISNGSIACLFEAGWKNPYEGIVFKIVPLEP